MEGLALILGPGFAVEGNEKLSSRLVGGRYRAPPFLFFFFFSCRKVQFSVIGKALAPVPLPKLSLKGVP